MLAGVLVAMLALAPASRAAARPLGDSELLQLEWPETTHHQELAAFLSVSLLPILDEPRRPTLAERLSRPPFAVEGSRVYLDLASLDEEAAAKLRAAARPAGAGKQLSLEKLEPVAEGLYLDRRYFSAELPALHEYLSFAGNPSWRSVKLRSVISGGVRRVWYHMRPVLEAVVKSLDTGEPLRYAPGVWFLAEHLDDAGAVTETHVSGKRVDWEWDYALYDRNGVAHVASQENGAVRAPTMCWGCHRTSERLPPFREFPQASPPMVLPPQAREFQPEVFVELTADDAKIVEKLKLTKGGDEVLGHYGGLAALELRGWFRRGEMPSWAEPLWRRLLVHVPELGR